ncbi:type II toxin-antitoxin system RelE/ParE family toxin [Bacteroides sp. AN502(2024)]
MAKYRLTHKAVEDLADIWNHTLDEWSERQAEDYYNMLNE